jgi:four helix bundle protein
MQDYKNLKVWAKSHSFVLKIYTLSKSYPKEENYGLTSQLRRASISIPANIAEGCAKSSNKDFARYLNIALGSLHEVEYFIILSMDLNYISKVDFETLTIKLNEIKGMLLSLLKAVKKEIKL